MSFRRVVFLILFALVSNACGSETVLDGADPEVSPPTLALRDLTAATVPQVNLSAPVDGPSRAPQPVEIGGLSQLATADADGFRLFTEGGEVSFLTGINVGSAIPGRLPAELKIDAETWRRWLPMIAGTGVHAIRIYTLQPPDFYRELYAYNLEHRDNPLYLVHGVWVPEELMFKTRDLFDPELLAATYADIDNAVAAVHGEAELPARAGYASGRYDADVSPWIVTWAFGVEMDPTVVRDSDVLNAGRTYEGNYVGATVDATPTEVWLAEMVDRIAGLEAEYGRTMPLTFSNWPTTDPLEHPTEPLETEDMVGIDANNLVVSPEWSGGLYASYHAYPYYPDFQRYEPGIADFEHRGEVDPYAGYLVKLRDHHAAAGLPVMVLEFGVPSSIGSAHEGSRGRNQGGHDEAGAMFINAELLRTQHELGLSGGFVFSWHDEWFKRTWNTMDSELPAGRRQLWLNPLTNESGFGLLAMDPGRTGSAVVVDGSDDDWNSDNSQAVYEGDGRLQEVRATHDEGYLHLRLLLEEPETWLDSAIAIGFDVVPGGNGGLPGAAGVGEAADTAIVIGPGHEANAFVRASNDYNDLILGRRLGFYEVAAADTEEGSGVWNPQRLATNRPLTIPILEVDHPIEWFELNPLPTGSSDPTREDYDSRTIWAGRGAVVELRVPWGMVGFSDPSSRSALVISATGGLSTHEVSALAISIAFGSEDVADFDYRWDPWNAVEWVERPKRGLQAFIDAVSEVTGG